MNTRKLLSIFILAIGLLGTYSCKKTTTTAPATTGTGKPFYCKIDGTVYEPSGGGRYYVISGGPTIQIVGDNAATTIEVRVTNSAVGTYAITGSGAGNNYGSVYINSSGREYISTTGEVKITKSDGAKMSGTFQFSAADSAGTVNVTVGEFNDIPKQ